MSLPTLLQQCRALNFDIVRPERCVNPRIVLAQKYHEETSYCHSFYTKLANVPISRLNCLEVDFINRIEFALYVSASAYYKFYRRFTALSTSPTTPFRIFFIVGVTPSEHLSPFSFINSGYL